MRLSATLYGEEEHDTASLTMEVKQLTRDGSYRMEQEQQVDLGGLGTPSLRVSPRRSWPSSKTTASPSTTGRAAPSTKRAYSSIAWRESRYLMTFG